MSLFGSIMRDMEHDPIFGAHSRAMNQMNRMMSSFFGGAGGFSGGMGMGGMLEAPFGMNGMVQGHGQDLMSFPGPHHMSPFGQMGGFPDFNGLMRNDGNSHSFSSMSVTSITSGPDGRPQVYQASNQTATAPGGVKETRKAVADSRTGTKKLAVGRHMGDRAHVRERMENMYTGQREENDEFVNLDDADADNFDREWRQQAYGGRYSHSASMPMITDAGLDYRHRSGHRNAGRHQEISYHHTQPTDPTPSVTIEELPPSDDEDHGRSSCPVPPPTTTTASSSTRRSPYTRERKQRGKRVKKH